MFNDKDLHMFSFSSTLVPFQVERLPQIRKVMVHLRQPLKSNRSVIRLERAVCVLSSIESTGVEKHASERGSCRRSETEY